MEERDYDYDYDNQDASPRRSMRGYQIVIIVLALVLAGLAYMYWRQTNQLKADFEIERQSLSDNLAKLQVDLDELYTENDSINYNLGVERNRADSLMQRIRQERSWNAAKVREYENELATLRTVMHTFVQQIDSLNTLNRTLIAENVGMRTQIASERLRADMAEEKADEMSTKIRRGSVVLARNINLMALNASDREVTRAARAARLRVDFVLSSNELAEPGSRNVYARITGPDGYVMANAGNAVFDHEGDALTYSAVREVDYQNQDLSVSLFYTGGGITAGRYALAIFMDGYQIGTNEIILR